MSSNESDQERFRQQWRDQVSAKGKGKGSEHQYGCCTTGNCELCKDKALQPKLMTAQPIVVTGFVDLPSLVEITKQLKGGALWSISRDLDHFPVTVSIIFVQQHAAEIFMEKSQQVPLQQDNVPLKVEWSGEDGPGPDIIDKSISSQVFSGHSTRAMGIVMAQGSGIQPGDISGLNDHIVDPPGGIIAMGKQAIKNSDGVVTREVVHVHFNSIDACLMARDIIDGTRKFADCEVMPLPDPCGGITEDTRPPRVENPPLVDLPGAEQPVMAKHDGPSTVPSVGMLEPMDDLIYFSEDEEDAKGKKQATEAANSPVTGVENVEQHLAGVTIEEGSAAE